MGPQYTTCVKEAEFEDLNYAYLAFLAAALVAGGIAAVFTFGLSLLVSAAAFFEALRYVLNWIVHGKLICLFRDPATSDCVCGPAESNTVCAIGEIVDTEHVGEDKNPIEDLDDDYGINLLLYPFDPWELSGPDYVKPDADGFNAYKQKLMGFVTGPEDVQGDLLARRISKHGKAQEFGYLRTVAWLSTGKYEPMNEIVGRDTSESDATAKWADYVFANATLRPEKKSFPVLHCEFEGSRPSDMLAVLEGFPFGTSFCKKNVIFGFLCKVLSIVLAPVVLTALAIAWAGNKAGSVEPALVGGGTIGPRDQVIVRGSWVYDAGHEGWNEVHAVRIVQKVGYVPPKPKEFGDFLARWCKLLSEVPEFVRPGIPVPGPPASGALVGVKPQDAWTHHPLIDGCRPGGNDPAEPPIR